MGTGVLSKVVKLGGNLYIGIAGEANKNIRQGFTSKDNIITGESEAEDTGNEVQIEKWMLLEPMRRFYWITSWD